MKKTVIIVFDMDYVRKRDMERVGETLHERGFDAFLVAVMNYPQVFNVFDLSTLPPAEIEEVRALIRDKAIQ